jgi:hypothetical protein
MDGQEKRAMVQVNIGCEVKSDNRRVLVIHDLAGDVPYEFETEGDAKLADAACTRAFLALNTLLLLESAGLARQDGPPIVGRPGEQPPGAEKGGVE